MRGEWRKVRRRKGCMDDRRESLWTERQAAAKEWWDAVRDRDWARAREWAEKAWALGEKILALDEAEGRPFPR